MPRREAADAAKEMPPPKVDPTLLILRKTITPGFELLDTKPEPHSGGRHARAGSSPERRPTLNHSPKSPNALKSPTSSSKLNGKARTLLPARDNGSFFVADQSGGAPLIRTPVARPRPSRDSEPQTPPVRDRRCGVPFSPEPALAASTPLDQRPLRPRPASAGARVDSSGVAKREIAYRVRPGSAHASSRRQADGTPAGKATPGGWNQRTGCDDLSMRLLDVDREQAWREPDGNDKGPVRGAGAAARGDGVTTSGVGSGAIASSARSLSHRKPAVPGAVCYGTNTRKVALPRRPTTTATGRQNRPPVAVPTTAYGRAAVATRRDDGEVATAPGYAAAFARGDFGGWEPSTMVPDDSPVQRYRYPLTRSANVDVARPGAYRDGQRSSHGVAVPAAYARPEWWADITSATPLEV